MAKYSHNLTHSNNGFTRNRNIYVSNIRHTEMSDDFFDDIEKIINKVKKKGINIDGYEIHISIYEKGSIENHKDDMEEVYDLFINEPNKIESDILLDKLIYFMGEYITRNFYPYVENFFKAFITINHDSFQKDFEEEYDFSMDKISDLPVTKICDILNNEIEWMGLKWKFVHVDVPRFNEEKDIYCQRNYD